MLAYQPAARRGDPMPEPVRKPFPAPLDIASSEEVYLTGLRLEQFYDPSAQPEPYYEEVLRRDPGDVRANVALAIRELRRALYDTAEQRLRTAVARESRNYTRPRSGEAQYYLGLALRGQGKLDARVRRLRPRGVGPGLLRARVMRRWPRSTVAAAASCEALGRVGAGRADRGARHQDSRPTVGVPAAPRPARRGRSPSRPRHGDRSARLSGGQRAHPGEALASRRTSRPTRAALGAPMRGADQSFLELATDYANAGLWDEAIDVLSQRLAVGSRVEASTRSSLYTLGVPAGAEGRGQKAASSYAAASRLSPDYCFPFRLESIDVLRAALRAEPEDARAHYYLGNLLYDLQPEAAMKLWQQAVELEPGLAIAHRNLAFGHAHRRNDVTRAIASLEAGRQAQSVRSAASLRARRALRCRSREPRDAPGSASVPSGDRSPEAHVDGPPGHGPRSARSSTTRPSSY